MQLLFCDLEIQLFFCANRAIPISFAVLVLSSIKGAKEKNYVFDPSTAISFGAPSCSCQISIVKYSLKS